MAVSRAPVFISPNAIDYHLLSLPGSTGSLLDLCNGLLPVPIAYANLRCDCCQNSMFNIWSPAGSRPILRQQDSVGSNFRLSAP